MRKPCSVFDSSSGKWNGILSFFGLTEKQLSGKHTKCPIPGCGGKDRFRYKGPERGIWFCSHCGSGGGLDLLMKIKGWSFAEAAKQVENIMGECNKEEAKVGLTDEQKSRILNRTWTGGVPVVMGDPVMQYLHGRGLKLEGVPQGLRCYKALPYQDHDGKTQGAFDAMLAKIVGPDGTPLNIHRTYVQGGKKAPVEEAKKLMPGKPISGGAVRLLPATEVVGIAEGIETALAATLLFNVPVWSVINTAGMEGFVPPEGIKTVIIFGDNDKNFAGHKSAYAAAFRLAGKGYNVDVQIPPHLGDWLDHYLTVTAIREMEIA